MDHLLRDIAPIPTGAWAQIDDEARERLVPLLAARRVVDWTGPGGWEHSAVSLGRTQ
ncbi:MAG: Linocin bacteriocin protein, partial [Pseudonocardia sp.]|nr:Linocin bacteriocin protein [Pseudonocardia sp.]